MNLSFGAGTISDHGQEEGVPEPGLLGLVLVAGLGALRRRR